MWWGGGARVVGFLRRLGVWGEGEGGAAVAGGGGAGRAGVGVGGGYLVLWVCVFGGVWVEFGWVVGGGSLWGAVAG